MTDWIGMAEDVASQLQADAADRDRANLPPTAEVELLRACGLLAADDEVTGAVTRIVSAADASIGHLIGYHYLHLWRAKLFDNPAASDRMRADPSWFWAGVSNPLDAALSLTPEGDGFVVDGRKTFATGASVADRLVVSATRTDSGEKLTFTVDAKQPGISYPSDWDNSGQRLTASGGVVFDKVAVDGRDVLGAQPADDVRLSLAALGFQLALTQVYVGIAAGALAQTAEYTRGSARPWFLSTVEKATDDPYILAGYGELVAQVEAVGLLTDKAEVSLRQATDAGNGLTPEQRANTALTISAAKVFATKVVNETTAKIFEFMGARATASKYGFDRFWRNARTLTLHDPVVYKAREVGAYFLTGEHPPFTGYS
ncbi:alkylation response protein AidB-like acyl-CoA dehydrogenase [Kibdelosporangium banguiense]|uniref:Dibenzothiophene monooxygenase n=1 Tax=Kibdelosporangium banguiense TaxID=1365924 RepID=A0ABS4TF13_9PSEU|nr:acyl-CoA dehydrogenase family protein [Kibdelosporangium banguiense]MBP2322993.1 alkylation response protein AidB-like acyl-CoA dehydrogenase [Kibdelosporangium banguiense]